jgi:secondary thiamine-phosphate synthase enzyme
LTTKYNDESDYTVIKNSLEDRSRKMTTKNFQIQIDTKGNADIHDITNQVEGIVSTCDIQNGIATIFTPSSTSALTTIEYESGCLADLRRLLDEIIQPAREYAHNARWGDGNGHSHIRAALLGPSLTVPFVNRVLTLGTWQQIIFLDFDNRSRRRKIIIQIIGD